MFTIPGASPQSGMIEIPAAAAAAWCFFCWKTISVFPPRSQRWQPLSMAARVIGSLK